MMGGTRKKDQATSKATRSNPFHFREVKEAGRVREPQVHVYGPGAVCDTEKRGYPTRRGRSPLEIVVDASEGFIPLWSKDMTLRWRFQERSMSVFENPETAKIAMKGLLGEALLAWGDAAPIKLAEREDAWDFEIVMRRADDCDINGCVLASAFFPDAGRHKLVVYPKMFSESKKEQVDTLIHEIGHVFGLRHFFAQVSEAAWPSEVFGAHKPFSIMNYGAQSELTDDDRADLKHLYELAWSGELTHINGTPIRLVRTFSATEGSVDRLNLTVASRYSARRVGHTIGFGR
jgi:Metallo-peptidase family M12B Reprolysin-like